MLTIFLVALVALAVKAIHVIAILVSGISTKFIGTAIFTPSAIVDEVRNKIGNSVFSKGAHGNYVRKRVSPSQPVSAYSSDVRNRLSLISKAWKSLGGDVIAAFNTAAGNFKKSNQLGQIAKMTGINLWQYLNNNLLNIGGDLLTDLPVFSGIVPDAITDFTIVASSGVATLTLEAALDANMKALIFASPGVPISRALVKSQMRQIDVIDHASTATVILTTPYVNKYPGGVTAGQKVYVGMKIINSISGESGKLVIFETIAS